VRQSCASNSRRRRFTSTLRAVTHPMAASGVISITVNSRRLRGRAAHGQLARARPTGPGGSRAARRPRCDRSGEEKSAADADGFGKETAECGAEPGSADRETLEHAEDSRAYVVDVVCCTRVYAATSTTNTAPSRRKEKAAPASSPARARRAREKARAAGIRRRGWCEVEPARQSEGDSAPGHPPNAQSPVQGSNTPVADAKHIDCEADNQHDDDPECRRYRRVEPNDEPSVRSAMIDSNPATSSRRTLRPDGIDGTSPRAGRIRAAAPAAPSVMTAASAKDDGRTCQR
jgi:hypothetical protein